MSAEEENEMEGGAYQLCHVVIQLSNY